MRPTLTRTSRTCSRRSTPRCSTGLRSPSASRRRSETRREAGAAGLDVAERRESQEACFLAGDDYRAFLERQGLEPAEGAIVDEDGVEVGRHDGVWRYTPGQRRGIGISAAEPLYALRSDAATNTLVVGPRGSLACSTVEVRGTLYAPVGRRRGEAAISVAGAARSRDGDGDGIHARARPARLRRRTRPDRGALRRRRGGRLRRGVVCDSRLGCSRAASSRQRGRDRRLRPRRLPARHRSRPRVRVRAPGRNLCAAFFVHQRNGTSNCCPSSTRSARASTR